jgi:hypothetical protein
MPERTIEAGQAIKAHGTQRLCVTIGATGAGGGGTACAFVGGNEKAAMSAAAAMISRRIDCTRDWASDSRHWPI